MSWIVCFIAPDFARKLAAIQFFLTAGRPLENQGFRKCLGATDFRKRPKSSFSAGSAKKVDA
jgi:hypothetical protein